MGVYTLLAPCFVCRKLFMSNPHKVPSYENEPICRECIKRVNKIRAANGAPPIPILHGAYEPVDEEAF